VIGLRREAWPGAGLRFPVGSRRLSRLRTPVLVVAAGLFGAAIAAVALVGFWDKEVHARRAVEARLAASQQHARALAAANARLRGGLADTRAVSRQLERSSAELRAQARSLLAENAKLVDSTVGLDGRGGALKRRALSVSRLTAALGNDVVSVLAYVTNTSLASLDPSYLKAQLDYLKPAIASIRSAADALGVDAGSYANAVAQFSAQATAYATALKRLADAGAGGTG
jgi:hypothetical protein